MNKSQDYKSTLKIVLLGVLLYCGIQHFNVVLAIGARLFDLVFPFVIGAIIAFIINLPMRKIESYLFPKKKGWDTFRRALAYLITMVLLIGIIVLALIVIIPEISDTIDMIIKRVPGAFDNFKKDLYSATANMPDIQKYIEDMNIDWSSLSSTAIDAIKFLSTKIFTSGFGIISGVVSGVTTAVVAFVFSIYVLFQKEKLAEQGKKIVYALFKEEKADFIVYVLRLSNKIFGSFFSGQCIEALLLGTMFVITLSIFRIHYAMLVGVIIAITALIPILGAFIGMGISAFLICMVSPTEALYFIIIFFAIQQVDNNITYPYIVGGSIGLPSIWVLVAVMVGGNLMGIAGIIGFIPLCSVLYTLFRDYVYKKLKAKAVPAEKYENAVPVEEEADEVEE